MEIKVICAGTVQEEKFCDFMDCPFRFDIGYGHQCQLSLLVEKEILPGTTIKINIDTSTAQENGSIEIDGVKTYVKSSD